MSNTKLTRAFTRLTTTFLLSCLLALGASEAFAVSEAAALYLRLAAGARAAGMGEAYVAVADDATATHWNPAGLGASPLSASWKEANVPAKFRPVLKYAITRRAGSSDSFTGFSIWAITNQGLVMYDGNEWVTGQEYETTTDEELSSIVRRYLQISDEELVNKAMSRIAKINNEKSHDELMLFSDRVTAALPAEGEMRDEITNLLVTLEKNYDLLHINWNRLSETEKRFMKDKEDGTLSEQDLDRLSVGLERSVRRYLPEVISLPFSLDFDGELTDMVVVGKALWVGTTNGLHRYDGKRWSAFRMVEDLDEGEKSPLPSNHITCLSTDGKRLFIGTDKGLVEYFGISWDLIGEDVGLPEGHVSAITYSAIGNGWSVVDGDIYELRDNSWKNYIDFKVAIDETPEAIAKNFAIYNTAAEQEAYLKKLAAVNAEVADEETSAEETSTEVAGEETGSEATETDSAEKSELGFDLGETIRAPIIAQIKGEVTSLQAHGSWLYVGTAEGLMVFDGKSWTRPGYRTYEVESSTTITDIALDVAKGDSANALMVASKIREHNDLTSDDVAAGSVVWVYRNQAGSRVNDIMTVDGVVRVATSRGALIVVDGVPSRDSDADLNNENTVTVAEVNGATWYGADNKVKFFSQPRRKLSLMYAQWLPELSDDLAYQFASYVQNIKGAGTFGLSLSMFDYGTVQGTDASGNPTGTDSPVDIALAVSYGMPVNMKTSLGATVKLLYSDLSGLSVGGEQGSGRATGFAVDVGLLHRFSNRFTTGVAVTNIGPKLAYIDQQQADPLPTNLAIGFALKPWRTDLIDFLVVTDANYVLVEDKFEPVFNGGFEILYADFIAFRMGRQHDDAGDIKTFSFGAGLRLNIPGIGLMPIDLAYIPSGDDLALANTLRTSVSFDF